MFWEIICEPGLEVVKEAVVNVIRLGLESGELAACSLLQHMSILSLSHEKGLILCIQTLE